MAFVPTGVSRQARMDRVARSRAMVSSTPSVLLVVASQASTSSGVLSSMTTWPGRWAMTLPKVRSGWLAADWRW